MADTDDFRVYGDLELYNSSNQNARWNQDNWNKMCVVLASWSAPRQQLVTGDLFKRGFPWVLHHEFNIYVHVRWTGSVRLAVHASVSVVL